MAVLMAAVLPVQATPSPDQAAQQTQALIAQHKKFGKAQGLDKAHQLTQLVELAEARYTTLSALMETDPAQLFRVALPEARRSGMPDEVQDLLLQKLELEGELEIVIEDFEDGSHRQHNALVTDFGERFRIHFSKLPENLLTGERVRILGLLLENSEDPSSAGEFAVSDNPEDILTLAAGGGSTGGSNGGTPAATHVFGEQKVLVMPVNFLDNSSQPWSTAAISNSLATGNAFIKENSYQQAWLTTTVTSWRTLPIYTGSSCDYNLIASKADQAATNAGINLGNYDRLVYIFPDNSCPYRGLGTVGGSPSRAWIKGNNDWDTITHELGHNMGLNHSRDYVCSGATLGGNCTYREYGDYPDIMGAWVSGHFNVYQKDRLGWLGSDIQVVSSSGTYQLSPHEQLGNQPLALKIFKGIDPYNGLEWWYYLEYRQQIGFDTALNTSSNNFDDGVAVHMGLPEDANSSFLLDMTPETAHHVDAALVPGDNFYDSESGVGITTTSADSTGAAVYIDLGGSQPTCVHSNPSLAFSPVQGPWVAAGTAVNFTLTLTNNDSSACSNNSFSLSTSKPSGWSTALSKTSISLAPGASGSATLTVTSATSASDGFYSIGTAVTGTGNSASGSVTYVVDNPVASNSPPVAKNDSASTQQGTAVNVAVLGNDSDPDGDALSVTSTSGVNGTATINGNGTLTYTPPASFSGTENFAYTISDGKGASASATVSVQVAATSTNRAPLANDDSASVVKGSSVTINVLANDSDPDGDSLTIISVNQGAKGAVKNNGNGTLTYTPAKNFKSSDAFAYTISDGSLTASATVHISLTASGDTGGGDTGGGGTGGGGTGGGGGGGKGGGKPQK